MSTWRPTATFFVEGMPRPKGSTRAFQHNRSGRVVTWQANRETLRPWQRAIAEAAEKAGLRPHRGPVMIDLYFRFPRPKAHLGARGLRPSAPGEHAVRPDLDKLIRAVLDALSGVAYVDDAQVYSIEANKAWADSGRVGVAIRVWQDPWGPTRRDG